jgi:hypothetical protein
MRVASLPDDAKLIVDWHRQMVEAGELQQTWGEDVSVEGLLEAFQRETVVYIDEQDGHPWFIAWVMDGPLRTGFLSTWTAPHRRQSKESLKDFVLVLHCLFTSYELACCITQQNNVALMLTKMGFSYLGTVQPRTVHVLYYPRERYAALQEHTNGG